MNFEIVTIADVSSENRATLLSIQALRNRNAPRLYILSDPSGAEMRWLEWYKRYGLEGKEISPDSAIRTHAKEADGYVVYDPAMPDTLNLAVCLAGARKCLVCAPSGTKRLDELGLRCVEDLRGKWHDKIEVYNFAIETVMNQCDLSVLANYEQNAEASPRADMDYVMAHRGFCMGCSVNDADYPKEAALWDKVQSEAPGHAIMLGWHTSHDSEATHVYFGSRHNVWVYCGGAANMSFHQHVKARHPFVQRHCDSAECDPNARYVTIALSDGDSWHSMADMQKKFWQDPRRGEVPLGWEVAPIFAQAGPAMLEYYFDTRTDNDYLVCGPSGIAYNYLSGFKDWQGYLKDTADAMRQTSLKTIWTINRVVRHLPGGVIEHRLKDGPVEYTRAQMEEFGGVKDKLGADWVDPEMVRRYIEGVPNALGFFQGWERIPGEGPRWLNGKLWCPTAALVRQDIEAVLAEFDDAAKQQPAPAFLAGHVNCYSADMNTVIQTVRRLEAKGYKVVRPDVFLCLAQDAFKKGLRR